MNNILTAIKAIVKNSRLKVANTSQNVVQNRANQTGDALEEYVKNAFADCFGKDTRQKRQAYKQAFSYLGNSTNPPDAMIHGGDAIEIKKLKTLGTSQLQLNSSYPKNKLHSNNSKICNECKSCEEWSEKDIIYIVGQVNKASLQNIFFVYGDLYCDAHEIYERVEQTVKGGISSLEDLEVADTNELGRTNKVDHLGISDLRIRGMWLIKTPFQHFQYLTESITDYKFKLVALIPKDKYNQFGNVQEFEEFCSKNNVSITDEEIENPQNPATFIASKLITYYN